MCEQCLTWPISFGEPLRGFWLLRARRDGNDWKKGEWGLVQCNDPTFIWKTTPVVGSDKVFPYTDEFANAFDCPPTVGHALVTAAVERGYKLDTPFLSWLYFYLADWIAKTPYTEEDDPLPQREEFAPVDKTIGREPIIELEASD